MGVLFILAILLILFVIIILVVTKGDNRGGASRCPFGYDYFGCQPECPLYEHCWGKRDD